MLGIFSCTFFDEISIHFFSPLVNWLFVLLSCRYSLYIMDTSPLSDMCFADISSWLFLVFYFLNDVFSSAEVLNFDDVHFISFFSDGLCFWSKKETNDGWKH